MNKSQEVPLFLLGVVPLDSVENRRRRGSLITYTPEKSYLSDAPLIGLFQGPTGHDEGGATDAATWLKRRPPTFEKVKGRVVEEVPPPGWFERLCQESGCSWFVPILHRLAGGEEIPLEEIQRACAAAKNGARMPEGELTDFFRMRDSGEI